MSEDIDDMLQRGLRTLLGLPEDLQPGERFIQVEVSGISLVAEPIDLSCYVVDTMSDEDKDDRTGVLRQSIEKKYSTRMPVHAADDFDEIYQNVLRIRAEAASAKKCCRKCGERIGQPHSPDCGYDGNVWEPECD